MLVKNTSLGYCCINITLQKDKKNKITTNRGMIKRTFKDRGIKYASELALLNVRDLVEIIKWNYKNNIKVYRMSSDIIPWMSEYELKKLPDYKKISIILSGAGQLAKKYGQRIGYHPGHFNVLASLNPGVVTKTIKELNQHGEVMDLMGLPRTPYAAINIHVNTTQGGKEPAAARFCANFQLLDDSVKSRLVIENDDKENQYTTEDLHKLIYSNIGTPITFDFHHHWCHPGSLTQYEALALASTTWRDVKQLTHFSSCKSIHEDATQTNKRAHSDYIWDEINDHGFSLDIELEAKAKELAVQKYLKQYIFELV